jgi:FMN phosphatase YigB (HAD superfamily)
MSFTRLALFDLDGVLADDRHRVEYALRREWAVYFQDDMLRRDAVWPQGRALYEDCILAGFDIGYLTGRREMTRAPTRKWLKRKDFDHKAPLIMRRDDDGRPLAELKATIVAEVLLRELYDEVWLWDDDPHVIQLTAALGHPAVARHCTWYTKPERMVRRQRT